ncbi:MAG: TIGR03013 family PEP-CTERM/XrtA system glycosyltransferase [Alphaproteobacteria bacterium]|nr:TIGR03013 family PEP-CTERM/XrtA system glycosyltransferase [Alphaproteobacteria bacterium]
MLRIFRHYVSPIIFVFMLVEFVLFVYANLKVVNTSFMYGFPSGLVGPDPYLYAIYLSLLQISLMWSVGLYRFESIANPRTILVRTFVVLTLTLPAVALFFLVVSKSVRVTVSYAPAVVGLVSLLACWIIAAIMRMILRATVNTADLNRKILIIGAGDRAQRVIDLVKSNPWSRIEIAGCLDIREEWREGEWRHPDVRRIQGTGIVAAIKDTGAVEIVLALQDRRGVPFDDLLECRMTGTYVTDYLSFFERESRKILIDELQPGWLIFSDGFRLSSVLNDLLKRLGDIAVSSVLLIIALPFLIVTAIAIPLESRGPALFRQERVGRNGRTFILYKFRSMRADAEKGGPQWAGEDDPRITRLGRFIRRTRIDEIPQVFNVLKGDMSFIGPRPERPHFVDWLKKEIPFFNERHRVRPGITGWAQINYPYGASVEDAKEKLSYDLYYIKNYSLLLDIIVLFSTIEVVLWPKGVR